MDQAKKKYRQAKKDFDAKVKSFDQTLSKLSSSKKLKNEEDKDRILQLVKNDLKEDEEKVFDF